jgi:hypothetical protein
MLISEFKDRWIEGFFRNAEVVAMPDDDAGREISSGALYSDGKVDAGTRLLI